MLLREVKGDNQQDELENEETSVNIGDKKITIKVQDTNTESKPTPQGKRQLLCE